MSVGVLGMIYDFRRDDIPHGLDFWLITCDGIRMHQVLRAETGPNGNVVCIDRCSGTMSVDPITKKLRTVTVYGNVEVTPGPNHPVNARATNDSRRNAGVSETD